MSELKAPPERADRAAAVPPPDGGLEGLQRHRDRKQRNQRVAAGVLAIIIALVTFAAVIHTSGAVEKRAEDPTPAPSPAGIFAGVGGWIAYGNDRVQQGPLGIWAVDPTRPNDPEAQIQLSDRLGEPLAWSSDGSKLLILRTRERPRGTPGCPRCWRPPWATLFVLNADGSETRVVTNNPKVGGELDRRGWIVGGSISPNGSQVVFGIYRDRVTASTDGIYTVDAHGGTPRLVLPTITGSYLFHPTFSPDGSQIAYLDLRMQSPSLQVVNADGTGVRVLHDVCDPSQRAGGPAWSPDGTHIAYSCEFSIWVVSADGSRIAGTLQGRNPYWSPDGSRIAFELRGGAAEAGLAIADADGAHIQAFGSPAHAGPWNPLASAVPGEPNSTATTGGEVFPFVYAIVALGVVGVFVLVWRSRRRSPPG